MSTFTCAACGGFKYNQTSVLLINQDLQICIDCHENGVGYVDSIAPSGIPAAKPNLQAVVESIYKQFGSHYGYVDALDWGKKSIGVNSEEELQQHFIKFYRDIWTTHYHAVTGKDWQ